MVKIPGMPLYSLMTLEDLYELIAALSSTEVEYFRLYCVSQSEGTTADQATLFEALLDETRKNSGHINRIQLDSSIAAGLGRELKRSLRFLYDERTVQSQIRSRMTEAEVLADKCLYAQREASLKEAHELAHGFERFYELLEIINLQKAGLQRVHLLEEASESRLQLEEEEKEVLRKLHNYIAYRNVAKEVSEVYRRPEQSYQGSQIDVLQRLFEQPILSDPTQALSLTARYYYLHLRSTYFYFIGDLILAWDHSSQLLELIRQKPFLVDLSTDAFMVTYFNNLGLALELGEYHVFEQRLDDFRKMPSSLIQFDSPKFLQLVSERSAFLELKYFLYRGLYVEGVERCELVASKLKAGLLKPDSYFEAQFYYFFAYFYYIVGQYEQAILWVDRVLDVPEFRPDVRTNALVLRLIIAFEQADRAYFDQELPAAFFFLEHSNRGLQAERALLSTLEKTLQETDPDTIREHFLILRQELLTVRQNPFEGSHFSSFDAVSWLDSRIAGVPFREVFSQRESTEKFRVIR